jgi:fructoselysine 6-phosphate deglycase
MNEAQIRELNTAIDAVKGREIENVYFVACGGSKAIFDPAQYIFDRESKIPAFVYTANEFNHRCPKGLGNKSLVISCSHSGNTPETVRATALAGEKGALTISFAFKTESPLWETTQHGVSYEWGPESDGGNRNNGMLFRVVFGVLNVLQPCEKYERAIKACDELDRLFRINMEKFAARADAFGSKYKRAPLIYTMSSGPCYGVAYSFAICLLQEMQWIHSAAIHSGEYFHGPFEVTDYDVPFLLIKNIGPTRPLDERAEAFAVKYSREVNIIDCAEFDMSGIDEDLYEFFAVLVLGVVIRTYADALADHRGHPLSVRRYMWRMEY